MWSILKVCGRQLPVYRTDYFCQLFAGKWDICHLSLVQSVSFCPNDSGCSVINVVYDHIWLIVWLIRRNKLFTAVTLVDIIEDHTPIDMNDSGVVDGSASENTPSSVADTLNSLNGEPEPYTKQPPRSSICIKVRCFPTCINTTSRYPDLLPFFHSKMLKTWQTSPFATLEPTSLYLMHSSKWFSLPYTGTLWSWVESWARNASHSSCNHVTVGNKTNLHSF